MWFIQTVNGEVPILKSVKFTPSQVIENQAFTIIVNSKGNTDGTVRLYVMQQGNFVFDKTIPIQENGKEIFSFNGLPKGDCTYYLYAYDHTGEVVDFLLNQKFTIVSQTSIPEFPSVVLPIAAILCLMFVFSRQKKQLSKSVM